MRGLSRGLLRAPIFDRIELFVCFFLCLSVSLCVCGDALGLGVMEKSHCQNKGGKEHGDVTTGKLQHKNCTTSTGTYYRFYGLRFVNKGILVKGIVEGTDLRWIQVFYEGHRYYCNLIVNQ